MTSIPYLLITAFSTHAFGGNPAIVFFADVTQPDEIFEGIATSVKQPMAVFVSPEGKISPESPNIASFDIRYFAASGMEVILCGHATLAAAKAVFADKGRVPPQVDIIEFRNTRSQILRTTKVGADMIEMRLPSCMPEEVTQEERTQLTPLIHKAFGRELDILHIAKGTGIYDIYIVIEIKEEENLKNSVVNTDALIGSGYIVHVVTTASSSGREAFVSRMFCPEHTPGGEDMVCGTAHCLIGPYWHKKRGILPGEEVKARQVSRRGGELNLVWSESENIMAVRGTITVMSRGEFYL